MTRSAPLWALIGTLFALTGAMPAAAQPITPPATPSYSQESIANSAANVLDLFAPNTFISIYGKDLSFTTKAMAAEDIRAGELPTVLISTGVRVLIGSGGGLLPANVYFVSPQQVNVLIPTSLVPGKVTLQLVNDARAGPPVEIQLRAYAPALFESDNGIVVATHGNGPLVSASSPAQPGEVVVLYATGLGPTTPRAVPNRIPAEAARLSDTRFQVTLNGEPVAANRILYAGVTPGFAGLFQINLLLPDDAPPDPEIRVGYPDLMSPAGRTLPLR